MEKGSSAAARVHLKCPHYDGPRLGTVSQNKPFPLKLLLTECFVITTAKETKMGGGGERAVWKSVLPKACVGVGLGGAFPETDKALGPLLCLFSLYLLG